jgi:hypothetical protein
MLSDEVETAQTVAFMDELAEADAAHRLIIEATHKALSDAGLSLEAAPLDKTIAIYWFLKRTIRYVPTPGTSPLVDQTLIPPATLLAMPDPEGDCPQFSMLACAMLRVCCIASYFKTIAADDQYPETYTHIYNVVDVGHGGLLPFDSSNGPAPGAEFARPGKTRVWPQLRAVTCAPRSTAPREGKTMQHTRSYPGGQRNSVLRRGLRGGTGSHLFFPLSGLRRLGQDEGTLACDQDGNCYDTSSGLQIASSLDQPTGPTCGVDIACGSNPTAGELAAAGFPLATAVATAPSPVTGNASPSPTTLLSALAADATQLVSPILKAATQQAPYYITNPATGQAALYNPNTGTFAGSVSTALSSISPTMIVIALGLVAALAFAGKGK